MGAWRTLLPLSLFLVFVGAGAYFGYQIYLWSEELAERGRKKMQKKNIVLTKDGMSVGVKGVSEEEYADRQQSYLVKAWNYSTLPAYKSRFWNRAEQERQKELKKHARAGTSTSSGAAASTPSSGSTSSAAQHHEARPAYRHAASNPGAFPS